MFLSSTVEDFGPVRQEIAESLRSRQFVVRLSEEPTYPVEPGVSSHEACLAVVRRAHVFVLLVGQRFGGLYRKQNKSVTWREWDEAMLAGLHPIVIIHKDANSIARTISGRRIALLAADPEIRLSSLEAALSAEFPDAKPLKHRLPAVQRFVDALRKGHDDNWIHDSWDGSPKQAIEIIDMRMSAMIATFQAKQHRAKEQAQRQYLSLAGLNTLAAAVPLLIARTDVTAVKAVTTLLDLCASKRHELFGFTDGDEHNLAVHFREGDVMRAGPRVRHERIPDHNRAWPLGKSHVGLAVEQNSLLVAGDIRQTDGWVFMPKTENEDREHYVSAVTVPIYTKGDATRADATFTVTSNRIDHFVEAAQPEVLTASIVGNMISVLLKTKEAS